VQKEVDRTSSWEQAGEIPKSHLARMARSLPGV